VFLGANLHLELLAILADSLRELPPGAIADPTAGAVVLVRTAGMALLHGIALAGPLLVFVFAVNLGISILGRMAPSLQLFFAVGPTLTLLASIVLLGIALPSVLSAWAWVVREGVFAAAEIASGAR
jgi:flagellar biosynthetic protein FliR